MKVYKVKVNNKVYEVELEKVTETSGSISVPAQTSANSNAPAGGNAVNSPMAGKIWKMLVSNGQSVNEGDCLCILEAMKMENEIVSPYSGTVNVLVNQGDEVNSNQVLFEIK